MCPEKGLSAIQIAARGIAQMHLGRIDEETTANIGIIQGGAAVNIVPATTRLWAKARSHNEDKLEAQTRHMITCMENAASQFTVELEGKRYVGKVTARVERDYDRMAVPEAARIVRLVHAAARALGLHLEDMATGGGCDANVLNKKGLEVANLATGMREIHTVNEWLDLNDLYTSAQIVLETVRLNADNQTRT
jgi:tripeptide aminopeptidase